MSSSFTAPPRHYLDNAGLPGAGLPHDRYARIAARRAFVTLKQTFQSAVDTINDVRGEWLKTQVRLAEDPVDLWMLRSAVFAALPERSAQRLQLAREIESLFPDSTMPGMVVTEF